ncbi:MAG: hypothetical protein OEL76_04435 [Siculibacillus sp.]|nr:hypothetical protein [Siculibacillus sp.]
MGPDSKYYFAQAEYPTSAGESCSLIYRDPTPDIRSSFLGVNGLSAGDPIRRGQLLLIPSLDEQPDRGDAVSVMRQKFDHEASGGTGSQSRLFNQEFSLLNTISRRNDELDYVEKNFSGMGEYLKIRLKSIKTDFADLEKLYVDTLKRGGKLNSDMFRQRRFLLEQRLKAQLTGVSRAAVLKNPGAASMRDSLRISHKSLQNAVRTNGSVTQVRQIGDALDRTSKLAAKAEYFDKFGKVLSVGLAAVKITEDYKKGGSLTAIRTAGRESAGIAGGLMAGEIGASAGAAAGTAIAVFFGVATGGTGFVIMGIGAVAGSLIFGTIGTEAAKAAYDESEILLQKGADKTIQYLIR